MNRAPASFHAQLVHEAYWERFMRWGIPDTGRETNVLKPPYAERLLMAEGETFRDAIRHAA